MAQITPPVPTPGPNMGEARVTLPFQAFNVPGCPAPFRPRGTFGPS